MVANNANLQTTLPHLMRMLTNAYFGLRLPLHSFSNPNYIVPRIGNATP